MAGGSLIAMDAEQKRAANGQFGSGGGSSGGSLKTPDDHLKSYFGWNDENGKTAKRVHAIQDKSGRTVDWTTGNVARAEKSAKYRPEDGHKIVKIDHKSYNKTAHDEAPNVASMSGEAGRQARKLARDCNTGRFRP